MARLTQEQINDLVERFYSRLIQHPDFVRMFAERGVDLEHLKERQREFLARLANEGDRSGSDSAEVRQVQERHAFTVDPKRAEAWMGLMEETVLSMDWPEHAKTALVEKIRFLLGKMNVASSESGGH